MKKSISKSSLDNRPRSAVLLPTWISATIVILLSVCLYLVTAVFTNYQSSNVRLYFINYHSKDIIDTYQSLVNVLSTNSFTDNLPLYIFWGLVGIVVYLFAESIARAAHNAAELRDELDYVHMDRKSLLRQSVQHFILRLAVSVIWLAYLTFFFKQILPYCVAAAIIGTSKLNILQDCLYSIVAITIMAISLHAHVVLFRLLKGDIITV